MLMEQVAASPKWEAFTFASIDEVNPNFDGAAFVKDWGRFVGSVHRHYLTRELYLSSVSTCPHPAKRDRLLAELREDPRNAGSVLAVIDERRSREEAAIEKACRRYYAEREAAREMLPAARAWLRCWYGVGGCARVDRRRKLRIMDHRDPDRRGQNEAVTMPLLDELRDEGLKLGVTWLLLVEDRIPGPLPAERLP